MLWSIEFYESGNSKYPVEEFINSLEVKSQARIARTLDLLEEFGIELGMPYARYLEKQLWELRARLGRNRYRIIYFLASGKTFILLHAFSKKTDTVSRDDLEIAKNRRDDYLSRRRKGMNWKEQKMQLMKNPEFVREYNTLEPEYKLAAAI